jgi:glycosyltransferase involved in cell wall biosynthesis
MIVRSQHRSAQLPGTEPEIAVVVPTLNEEGLIKKKIEDVKRSEYPRDKINFMVVDGGSDDQTVKKVKEEISRGEKIRLICLSTTQKKGRSDQPCFRKSWRGHHCFF